VYRAPATGTSRSPGSCTGSHDDWLACVTALACRLRAPVRGLCPHSLQASAVPFFSKWRRRL